MSPTTDYIDPEVGNVLDQLAASPATQSNCMFQLALILARIAVEPCAESYKGEASQAILEVIRAKPKSNVVRLFGVSHISGSAGESSNMVQRAAL